MIMKIMISEEKTDRKRNNRRNKIATTNNLRTGGMPTHYFTILLDLYLGNIHRYSEGQRYRANTENKGNNIS
jgi:hypothetical protein